MRWALTWVKLLVSSILLIGLSGGLATHPVFADRHCALALENYYAARQQTIQNNLTDESSICEHEFNETTRLFAEAIADATNCGCDHLKQVLTVTLAELTAVYEKSKSTNTACQELRTAVLEAQPTLEDAMDQCH